MTKKLVIVFTLMILFFSKNTAYAYQDSNLDTIIPNLSIKEIGISPRVNDVIVYKYRIYKGVAQYRRWNQTKNKWVDSAWINL